MHPREPIFTAPRSVVGVLLVLCVVHALRLVLSDEQDDWFVLAMAFIPARYFGLAGELPGGGVAEVTSFVTHMLVHGDLTHLIVNGAWLLAFGSAIAARTGGIRFVSFGLLCGIAGAILFLILNPLLLAPVVGASGAIAGLFGGAFRFFFSAIDAGGLSILRQAPQAVPRMSLGTALRDRRVLVASGLFIITNILIAFGLGVLSAPGGIAWEAHLGGFIAGFFTFGMFDASPQRST